MKLLRTKCLAIASSVVIAGMALSACSTTTPSSSGATKQGTLTFAATGTAAPFSFLDNSGRMTGYDVSVCTSVAEGLGYHVLFKSVDFQATLAGVTAGRFDGVCSGTAATPEREASKDFLLTSPISTDGLSAIVLADSGIHRASDLKEQTWGKIGGGFESNALAKYLNVSMDAASYPGLAQAVIDLKSHRIDAIPVDALAGGYLVKKDSALSLITPVQEFNNAIILRSDNKLRAQFNKKIAQLRADGTLDRLQVKWFGRPTAPVQ